MAFSFHKIKKRKKNISELEYNICFIITPSSGCLFIVLVSREHVASTETPVWINKRSYVGISWNFGISTLKFVDIFLLVLKNK